MDKSFAKQKKIIFTCSDESSSIPNVRFNGRAQVVLTFHFDSLARMAKK